MNKEIRKYSRTRERADGIPLEIYRWSLDLFYKIFLGERGDVFLNAFLFKVMRTGRILYDPKNILQKMKRFAQTHNLPSSHLKSLKDRARISLHSAEKLLESGELEGAELEIRKSAEELRKFCYSKGT